MTDSHWYVAWVNPTPWTSPNVTTFKGKPRVYKSQELSAYQSAVADELLEDYPDLKDGMPFADGDALTLRFYFWRHIDQYGGVSGRRSRNRADVTNMQKATEDALQGILFDNDRHVRRVESVVVEQGPSVDGRVVINVSRDAGLWPAEQELLRMFARKSSGGPPPPPDADWWSPAGDLF